MAREKNVKELTDRVAKSEAAPAKGYIIVNDGGHKKAVRGFGLLITAPSRERPAGARSWVYRYRHNGRDRRYTIGAFPSWNVATARECAAELDRMVDEGRDPQGEKDDARKASTVSELCDRYLVEHAVKKRSKAGDERMIERIIRPALGSRKVADVKFADIDALHRRLTAKGGSGKRAKGSPYAANRAVALLSKMFSLSIKWEMRTDNPAKGIERNPEEPRERYLTQDELDRLLDVLDHYEDQQVANIVRLLLLTGCRSGEAFAARWDQFDLEHGVWKKPSTHTKQKKTHRLQLSGPALFLLNRMKEVAKAEYLFPGKGVDHVTTIKKSWQSIRKRARIEGEGKLAFRVHDTRHSNASFIADDGGDLLTIGAMLGHSDIQTTRRYTHLFDDKLKAAAERVGARMTRKPKAEVNPIGAQR
jgi:integrase